MGEYEDRYPDAYGRGQEPAPQGVPPPTEASDRFALRRRFGLGPLGPTMEPAPAWQHAQRELPSVPPHMVEPTAQPAQSEVNYRGVGPRGYVRSPERIYEDLCDRLTENPFIDASDITVSVTGSEVRLTGSVDSAIVARQVEVIARQVSGVSWVHNALRLRPAGEAPATSSHERIDRGAAIAR
jgi:hypothetical protein